MEPRPSRRVPVWVGGKSRAALARAARHDGWLGMNYPMDEIRGLLATLEEERHKHLDAGGTDHGNFRRFVIPLAMPSKAVYDELAGWGVDATVVMPWGVENPECASLEAKLEAMQRFADSYL
jgi:alkanesulfonate monooxygenase SsuD/methylene tetrahydromethanopterin reductase-like flavin-dependent oxidoreductase (luciferase family)